MPDISKEQIERDRQASIRKQREIEKGIEMQTEKVKEKAYKRIKTMLADDNADEVAVLAEQRELVSIVGEELYGQLKEKAAKELGILSNLR